MALNSSEMFLFKSYIWRYDTDKIFRRKQFDVILFRLLMLYQYFYLNIGIIKFLKNDSPAPLGFDPRSLDCRSGPFTYYAMESMRFILNKLKQLYCDVIYSFLFFCTNHIFLTRCLEENNVMLILSCLLVLYQYFYSNIDFILQL